MPTPLIFSAFVMNTASHILHGVWRREDAGQIAFNSLAFWVKLAQELERGLFDVLFFADVHGVYGRKAGSYRKHVEFGLQIPSNDPAAILSALASHTQHLGFAFTSSIVQDHPFSFARKSSILDHASEGRIAWNIVTNGLPCWCEARRRAPNRVKRPNGRWQKWQRGVRRALSVMSSSVHSENSTACTFSVTVRSANR